MIEESLSPPARTSTPVPRLSPDVLAARVEEELDRLRAARPHLASRLDRAATILVVHLSSPPRSRPVRCRVRRGGRTVLLVDSLRAAGVVYEVSPRDWSCSCPDYHRSAARACKHGAACYVLWRASLGSPQTDVPREPNRGIPCADCKEKFPRDRLIEVQEDQAGGTLNPGQRVCRLCAPRHSLPAPGEARRREDEEEGGPPTLPEVYTARYGAQRLLSSGKLVPVRISMQDPRPLMPLPYDLADSVPELMPERDQLGEWRNFSPRFWRKLDTIGPEKIATRLARISDRHGGKPLALCCFEDLTTGDECHRAVVIAWMRDVAGVEVREITDDVELLRLDQLHVQAQPMRPR